LSIGLLSSLYNALLKCDTKPFYLPIIPIIFKSNENLDNNYKKTIKNGPFIGYSETSDLINCGPLIEIHQRDPFTILHLSLCQTPHFIIMFGLVSGAKPPLGTFYYTTLFTLYKTPEKKWHRSVKMDKNINVHFSKVPGKCCKRPL